jgi:hypothetical protein
MNFLFPGNDFKTLDSINTYLNEHGEETLVGQALNYLRADGGVAF